MPVVGSLLGEAAADQLQSEALRIEKLAGQIAKLEVA
jgi:hypothetical protein